MQEGTKNLQDSKRGCREMSSPFLDEHGYGLKYVLGNAQIFIIEGMEKVRHVIEGNRKRKLMKYKKLSNNTVIEIDNCSPWRS